MEEGAVLVAVLLLLAVMGWEKAAVSPATRLANGSVSTLRGVIMGVGEFMAMWLRADENS